NVRADANLWTTFETIAAEVSQLVGAERLVLFFDEVQSGRAFLWTADQTNEGALRISQSELAHADADRYRFEAPGDAWRSTPRSGPAEPDGWDVLAVDSTGRRIAPRRLAVPDPWTGSDPWVSIIGLTIRFA